MTVSIFGGERTTSDHQLSLDAIHAQLHVQPAQSREVVR
jgi:hypothetical protein